MNRQDFLTTLDKALGFLEPGERGDILNDYEEHFRNELAAGKNEFQIASDLGNPVDIAEQYRQQAKEAPQDRHREKPAAKRPDTPAAPPRVYPPPAGAYPPAAYPPPPAGAYPPPPPPYYGPPGAQAYAQPQPAPPRKKKTVGHILGTILGTALYTLVMAIVGFFLLALVAAGWGLIAGLVGGGIGYAIAACFTFSNAGLILGMALACAGIACLGIALAYLMVKATVGLFKLAWKIVMRNVNALKEIFA